MNVSDAMTSMPITVKPETDLAEAARLMVERRISGLPVVDDAGALVGILSEGDLLRRAETDTGARQRSRWHAFLMSSGRIAEEYVTSHSRLVGDLMTRTVIVTEEATTLSDAVGLMERHGVRRLPVMRDGVVVGLLSRADLVRLLSRALTCLPSVSRSDPVILRNVREELARNNWMGARNIQVAVDEGVVQLDGIIFDERAREALLVAARNVGGVTGVEDRLTWVEPNTGMSVPGTGRRF